MSHKNPNLDKLNWYKTLLVGASVNLKDGDTWYDLRDDIPNDNISYKNHSYCELTGIYWLWKHCQDDNIGVCHYRRFFTKKKGWRNDLSTIIDKNFTNSILAQYDIILPEIHSFGVTVSHYLYNMYGSLESIMSNTLRNIFVERYPDYLTVYDQVMNGYFSYTWNMMVANEKNFKNYCSWMFDILFEYEEKLNKLIDFNNLSKNQQRLYGFVSERLLTIWVNKNKLKVYQCPVLFTEEDRSINGQIKKWAHFHAYYFRKGTPLNWVFELYCKKTNHLH